MFDDPSQGMGDVQSALEQPPRDLPSPFITPPISPLAFSRQPPDHLGLASLSPFSWRQASSSEPPEFSFPPSTWATANIPATSHPPDACSTAAVPPRRSSSCTFCHVSKVRCGGSLPCPRCRRLDRAHLCEKWKKSQKKHSLLRLSSATSGASAALEEAEEKQEDVQTVTAAGGLAPPRKRTRHTSSLPLENSSPPSLTDSSSSSSTYSSLIHLSTSDQCDYIFTVAPFSSLSAVERRALSPAFADAPVADIMSRCLLRGILTAVCRGGLRYSRAHQWLMVERLRAGGMLAQDLETLLHFSSARNTHTPSNDMMVANVLPTGPPVLNADLQCDGSVCNNICLGVRRLRKLHPCVLTFKASPLQALEDQPYNNLPVLVVERLHSPATDAFVARLESFFRRDGAPVERPPSSHHTWELAYTATVNRAFERLFGYSQAEIRAMFIQWGWGAPFLLAAQSEWELIAERDVQAENGQAVLASEDSGWEGEVCCRDQRGRDVWCYVAKRFELDDLQLCGRVQINYLPHRRALRASDRSRSTATDE